MRQGIRYAVDFGLSRIGLAKSNPDGTLAFPVKTITNDENAVADLVDEIGTDCLEIYVGLPLNLAGEVTQSTVNAVMFAKALSNSVKYQVLLLDERLSSTLASSQLREIGKSQRNARGHIDQMAAVAILEYALAMDRNTGSRPGIPISQWIEDND